MPSPLRQALSLGLSGERGQVVPLAPPQSPSPIHLQGSSWLHVGTDQPFASVSIGACYQVWAVARDGSAFYRGSVSPSQPAGEWHPHPHSDGIWEGGSCYNGAQVSYSVQRASSGTLPGVSWAPPPEANTSTQGQPGTSPLGRALSCGILGRELCWSVLCQVLQGTGGQALSPSPTPVPGWVLSCHMDAVGLISEPRMDS